MIYIFMDAYLLELKESNALSSESQVSKILTPER